MNKTKLSQWNLWAAVGIVGAWGAAVSSQGADVALFEWGVHGDATIYKTAASLPGNINASAFDFATGLGTVTATYGNPGPHYFAFYVDHEIDEAINTFFNEYGEAVNTPKASQSWEIDEPGFAYGDIYSNFLAGTLDNSNGVPSTAPDDVAMALAWQFTVGAGETAAINMQVGRSIPATGFYLAQTDPDSAASIYYSSSLAFRPIGAPDGGGTAGLLLLALLGLNGVRRKLGCGV